MLRYMISLILFLSSANSWQDRLPHNTGQVASESQVKFALESNYDDTGPGAKKPEFAYSTYKNLEDALIAYLDDPDTKLPEHEREKAINKLTQFDYKTNFHADNNLHKFENFKLLQKPVNGHSLNFPTVKFFPGNIRHGPVPSKNFDGNHLPENHQSGKEFKFQKFQAVKGNPLSLAHYTRDPDLQHAHDQFAHPKYQFSYGVHDKITGDSKTAQESRDGGFVRGFYSFIDSDGKTRTVHYTADDQLGFRANVQKT